LCPLIKKDYIIKSKIQIASETGIPDALLVRADEPAGGNIS